MQGRVNTWKRGDLPQGNTPSQGVDGHAVTWQGGGVEAGAKGGNTL